METIRTGYQKILASFVSLITFSTPMVSAKELPIVNEKEKRIVMLGDSLSAGYGVQEGEDYPALVQKYFADSKQKITIINASISGSTSAGAVSRLKWQLKNQPTHLFLALGANDGLRGISLDSTEKNLEGTVKLALEKNLTVWIAGIKIPPNYGPKYVDTFEGMYKRIAAKYKAPLLPFLLEGVGGEREFNQADGIHPNPKGHRMIADHVIAFINKNLKMEAKQ